MSPKKIDPARPPATTAGKLADLSAAARRAALERWQGWADDLATGGAMPPVADVLAAGVALGIPDAIDALSRDAAALVQARELEDRIARRQDHHAELLAPHGGTFAALKAAIDEARARLKELERVRNSVWWDGRLGSLKAQLQETRSAAPRMWPPAPKRRKPAAAQPAPAKAKRSSGKRRAGADAVEIV